MTFGGKRSNPEHPDEELLVGGFLVPSQLFFSLLRITLMDDYDYEVEPVSCSNEYDYEVERVSCSNSKKWLT